MSWFTEIAGKAEDLLNKVDKSAATALQSKTKFVSTADVRVKTDRSVFEPFASPLQTASSEHFSFTNTPRLETKKKPHYSTPKKKSENDDELLLHFLNSPERTVTSPKAKMSQVKQPVNNPVAIVVELPTETLGISDAQSIIVADNVEQPSLFQQNDVTTNSNETIEQADVTSSSVPEFPNVTEESIQEARLRAEHAEIELRRMQKKLEHWNSQISGNDKMVRELQERDNDLVAALDAKDSQLAVLKVRFEEADNDLQNKRRTISELKTENERLSKLLNEDMLVHSQSIDILRNSLSQTELELSQTKENFQATQNEHLFHMSKSEEEQRHLAENVTNLQRKWSEQNERNKDLLTQLQTSSRNFENLQEEYADYKQKAQRILQSKEKLILSLKEGNWDKEKSAEYESSSAVLAAEMDSVKQERDMLREELRRTSDLWESCRNEIQDLEKMSQNDSNVAREHCRNLEDQLHQERLAKDKMQLQSNQLKEENQFLKENASRSLNNLQTRIQDREMEIEKLRKQLTAKSLSTVSQDELESRLHALTENLIQKQTIVEALSTEKNSLVLQLERLEQQLKEAQMSGAQNHIAVGVTHNESERKQKPLLFLENPFDSHLTRRVKRAYGSIDALSIRMGVFFRRYPIARMFIIVYMLLLHLWVMIVLLTYEPEVHTSAGYKVVPNEK